MEHTKEELQELANQCVTYADLCRKLNLVPRGGNYVRVKQLLVKHNINISHFLGRGCFKGKKRKGVSHFNLDDVLVENSSYKNTVTLKNKLFKAGLKEQKCELCGYSENLELHHINGIPIDNRLENLQILCPNCHAKTENFRGKNINQGRVVTPWSDLILSDDEIKEREEKRKADKQKYAKNQPKRQYKKLLKHTKICVYCNKTFKADKISAKYCSFNCYNQDRVNSRPNIITLIKTFKELKSFVAVGKHFNVSDKSVMKWCKLYKIPTKSKELKDFLNKIEIKE